MKPLGNMQRRLAHVVDHRAKQAICVFRFGVQQVGKGHNDLPPVPAQGSRSIDQVIEIGDN